MQGRLVVRLLAGQGRSRLLSTVGHHSSDMEPATVRQQKQQPDCQLAPSVFGTRVVNLKTDLNWQESLQ